MGSGRLDVRARTALYLGTSTASKTSLLRFINVDVGVEIKAAEDFLAGLVGTLLAGGGLPKNDMAGMGARPCTGPLGRGRPSFVGDVNADSGRAFSKVDS